MAKSGKAKSTPSTQTDGQHGSNESSLSKLMPPPGTRPQATPIQQRPTDLSNTASSSKKRKRRGKRNGTGKDSFSENTTTVSDDTTISSAAQSPVISGAPPAAKKIRNSSSQLRESISAEQQPIFNKEPELFGVYAYSSAEESEAKQPKRPTKKRQPRVQSYSPSEQAHDDQVLSTSEEKVADGHAIGDGSSKLDAKAQTNIESKTPRGEPVALPQPQKLSDGRYACPLKDEYDCSTTFADAKTARRHTNLHTHADKFKCQVCGKGFYRKDKLNIHSKVHSKDEPSSVELANPTDPTPKTSQPARNPSNMNIVNTKQPVLSKAPFLSTDYPIIVTSAESETETEDTESESEDKNSKMSDVKSRNSVDSPLRSQGKLPKEDSSDDETSDSDNTDTTADVDNSSSSQTDDEESTSKTPPGPSFAKPPASLPSQSSAPLNTTKRKRHASTAAISSPASEKSRKRFKAGKPEQSPDVDMKDPDAMSSQESSVSSDSDTDGQSGSASHTSGGLDENGQREDTSTETGSTDAEGEDATEEVSNLPTADISYNPRIEQSKAKDADQGRIRMPPRKDNSADNTRARPANSSTTNRLMVNVPARTSGKSNSTLSEQDRSHVPDAESSESSEESEATESVSEESSKSDNSGEEDDQKTGSASGSEDRPKATTAARRTSNIVPKKMTKLGTRAQATLTLSATPPTQSELSLSRDAMRKKAESFNSEGKWVVVSKEGQKGRFSEEEVQTLLAWRDSFCHEYQVTHTDFNNIMTASLTTEKAKWPLSYLTKREFMQQYYDQLPHRNRRAMLRFRERHFQNVEQGPWTHEDDKELQDLVHQLGPKWVEIGQMVGRTQDFVSQRWRHKLNYGQETLRGEWSPEEVTTLEKEIEAIAEAKGTTADDENLVIPWNVVSQRIGNGRTAQQCSNKWRINTTRRVNGVFVKVPLSDRIPGSVMKAPRTPSKMSKRLSGDTKAEKRPGKPVPTSKNSRHSDRKQYKSDELVQDSDHEADDESENHTSQSEEETSSEEDAGEEDEEIATSRNALQNLQNGARLPNSSEMQSSQPENTELRSISRSASQRKSKTSSEKGTASQHRVRTPGSGPNLTQIFNATQASSSVKQTTGKKSAVSKVPDSVVPDRPSPDMSIRRRPLSSPLQLLKQQIEGKHQGQASSDTFKSPNSFVSAREGEGSSSEDDSSTSSASDTSASADAESESGPNANDKRESGESSSETGSGSDSDSNSRSSDSEPPDKDTKPASHSSFWQEAASRLKGLVPGSQRKATQPETQNTAKDKKRTLADTLKRGRSVSLSDADDSG